MDIWEANLVSTAFTPHPCSVDGQSRCESDADCGAGDQRYSGVCDKDGCDFNSFRMGDKTFYGTGMTVDTSKPITVVTQFITNDGTDAGTLSEIKRFYVQGGKTIPNSMSSIADVKGNSITDDFCAAQKTAFGDNNYFKTQGGLAKMGEALKSMVLVLSIWDDHTVNMVSTRTHYFIKACSRLLTFPRTGSTAATPLTRLALVLPVALATRPPACPRPSRQLTQTPALCSAKSSSEP
jgi:cellulose 1,4-beta-cellobiosidase